MGVYTGVFSFPLYFSSQIRGGKKNKRKGLIEANSFHSRVFSRLSSFREFLDIF